MLWQCSMRTARYKPRTAVCGQNLLGDPINRWPWGDRTGCPEVQGLYWQILKHLDAVLRPCKPDVSKDLGLQ